MDIVRTARAEWNGGVPQGNGRMSVQSGAFAVPYSFNTRMGDEPGTNPEELIGAAHAGCFSMALAFALTQAGHAPTHLETTAKVHLARADGGFSIPTIELQTRATVPGIDEAEFSRIAQDAKANCPVSKALAGVNITLDASLASA